MRWRNIPHQTRILYKMGNLTTNELGECELFEEIKDTMLNTYFPNEYNKLLEENNEYKRRLDYLSIQRKCNQLRADKYRNENEKLKREIEPTNYIVPSRLTKRLFRVNLIIQKKGSTVDGLPD